MKKLIMIVILVMMSVVNVNAMEYKWGEPAEVKVMDGYKFTGTVPYNKTITKYKGETKVCTD